MFADSARTLRAFAGMCPWSCCCTGRCGTSERKQRRTQSDLQNTAPAEDAPPPTSTMVPSAWAAHPSPPTLLQQWGARCHRAPSPQRSPHPTRASPRYGTEQLFSLLKTTDGTDQEEYRDPVRQQLHLAQTGADGSAPGQHGRLGSRQLRELSGPEMSTTKGGGGGEEEKSDEFFAKSAH